MLELDEAGNVARSLSTAADPGIAGGQDTLPCDIDSLSEQQQIRLTHVLDEYLQALEQGVAFNAEEACRDEPALLGAVQVYLEKLNSLYGIVDSGDRQATAIPQRLGEFTLIREIGRGGMGIVYEATQAGMERSVALKLLPLAATFDARQISRFQNESRAAGSLHHPHIVPVYSVGEADGVHYYAMQLIDGISIDDWIHQRIDRTRNQPTASAEGKLVAAEPFSDWRLVVGWAIDCADALQTAHEAGVIHRDIKPSNLLLDRDEQVWITDFGLARCQSNGSLTRSGDVVGTMRYMSPEQAAGQSALVDGRTDIYSLAAAVYEMLSLTPAYPGDDGPAILKAIDQHDIVPLRHLCQHLPRDLETVIAKAMSKSRDERYETAAAFADDLRRVLADEPTLARPPTVVDQVTRWAAKHRRSVLASMLVVGLGFVGLAISTARYAALKRISDVQTIRAETGEQLARGAVDRLGSQMAELLADIPAAEPVRRELLRETLDYYEQFAAAADADPELRETLAVTYGKIGTLHTELGSMTAAIQALETSEQLFGELADESIVDSEADLQWSISQNNLAQTLHRAGRLEDAARYFARAINTQEELLARAPSNLVRGHLATTLNNLGLLLSESGAASEAEERYLRAIGLLTPSSEQQSRSADRQQLASVQGNLSGLLSDRDPRRAIEYARDALSNQTEALQQDPGNAKLATQVIVTLNTLGKSQLQNDQSTAASETFARAIEIGKQLLVRWPDQPTYRRDLVISWNHLGLALSKAGQLPRARAAFEQALQHQRPLAAQYSADAETHSMLGGVLNNLGFLLQQLGDPGAAADAFAEAVKHQTAAAELAPEVNRYRDYLKKHQHNLAEVKGAT
jgi:serine/threonine protein kinase/tetratricopeptide (TPR) repeat protein